MGRLRDRTCPSVTLMTAPSSRGLRYSVIMLSRCRLTRLGCMLRRRNMMTLGNFSPLAATSSPKPKSCVRRIRFSSRAFVKISGSGSRSSPWSRRCTASCPTSARKGTTRGEIPMSTRNLTQTRLQADARSLLQAMRHIAGIGLRLQAPDMGTHLLSLPWTYRWQLS